MLNNKKKIMLSIIVLLILIALFIIYIVNRNSKKGMIDLNSLIEGENQIETNSENLILETREENNSISVNTISTQSETNEETIVVHITGEIKKEGVIYLEKGSRIIDAIKKAGGATKQADLSQVNLAYELQDGQKIYIPNKNEEITEYIVDGKMSDTGSNKNSEKSSIEGNSNYENVKININTATLAELDNLPGIGPAIAQKIIEYREEDGGFNSIEDLQNVKGIGQAKYEDIKERVTV